MGLRLPLVYNTNGYELGVYEVNGSTLHVSPGIGTLQPDVRFLCRPEVTLLQF